MTGIRQILLSIFLLAAGTSLLAQSGNKYIRRGNSDFEDKDFSKAEENYVRSLSKEGTMYKGLFNLGDVYYERNDYRSAGALFDSVARMEVDPGTRSKAFYNLGNSLLSASLEADSIAAKALPLSIESYKQALRLAPEDTAAKYNLAYAQMMLKDQQQDQQNNQDQQQQQQDQQQQQQDQQKSNGEQQQSQSQQQPRQISKEDAERMLEAMKNDEKKTLEKVKTGQIKGKAVKTEKDW